MARKKDPNSVRQQALSYLGTQTQAKREVVIDRLMARFAIGQPYAATLYAQYRTDRKAAGTMVQVFSIRDRKDGQPVEPYLKVENVLRHGVDDALSEEDAIYDYLNSLTDKQAAVTSMLEAL